MNPRGLSTSKSTLLAGAAEPFYICSQKHEITDAVINKQIEITPAAMESLKADTEAVLLPQSSTASKVSQFMRGNGLLRKVSSAFAGRMRSKSHTKDLPEHPGYQLPALAPLSLPEQKSRVCDVDLRINESLNLRKDKVHRVLGGMDPRSGPSDICFSGDPFVGLSDATKPPTEFERRLRSLSQGSSVLKPLDEDPFDSESVFRSDLDSLLPTPPIASSTPRKGLSVLGIIPGPQVKRTQGNASENADPSGNVVEMRQTNVSARAFSQQPAEDNIYPTPDCKFSYVPVVDCPYRKRHPSPDKRDLDVLVSELCSKFPELL
ncbi:hypothetical protein N656DRAFT_778026 [Canariomyces notabilis]|uniref:Uncharacterized protein n=1 Tax=Canariomyces notabilis TaxID=2074819 RepID=A0AAN6TGY3_9PEZI|nr:hypothetical protein N656DRAFT_778026 [Canariomyces arenarius]